MQQVTFTTEDRFQDFTCLPCNEPYLRSGEIDDDDRSRKVSMEMILAVLDDKDEHFVAKKDIDELSFASCGMSLSSITSLGSSNSLRISSPMTRAFDRIETKKRQCRFFRSKRGCRAGSKCKFEHSI